MTYKILFVDDSKLARMAMAKALNSLHPEWLQVEATNADEAIAVVRETAVDIVLVDFNMPGRDGLVFAAELQKAKPKMPVAVISANHQDEIVQRAAAVGATFLPKPLTEQSLREFLNVAELRLKAETR